MVGFRSFRYLIWFIQIFLSRHKRIIFVGLFLGIILAIGISLIIKYDPKIHSRVTIGLVGQYSPDNPPSEITSLLSSGLTKIAPDGQPLPAIASSWSPSADLTTYTFYLDNGLKWSDGTPLKARDIDYKFKDAVMVAISDYAVEVKLKESYTPLPVVVSRPIFKKGLIGAGPYKIGTTKITDDKLVEMELVAPLDSGLPDINFHFYPNESSLVTALKLGEVKEAREIQALPENDWKFNVASQVKKDRFVGIFLNTADPDLSDKSIRQALAYAIENKNPASTVRAYSPISDDSWAYNAQVKRYDYDPQKGKQLISKVASASANFKITISTFPSLLPIAEQVKNDWRAIGINADTQVVSTLPDNYQALLITQTIPPDPDQYNLWHSTQGTNITHLKDPKVDKLLEDGRKTDGMKARKPLYLDFQRFLVEDTPVIFLYHPVVYTLTRP